ncbi:ubiquitinyl hydrolase [Auricularia subglabra TFB-10046 SS5]|nr:ubiquitinyl hydrolase [Auricularia subglabra TFB-10046 SS5]
MTSCAHIEQIARLPVPRLADAVHREECTQCFDNQDGPDGVDVCLSCFNGGCVGNEDRHHAQTHYERTQHPFSLNIRRTPKKAEREDQPPPAKMTKLAIVAEREEDKYEWTCVLRCWACEAKLLPELGDDPRVKRLVDGVMQSMSSARQSEVKAWEEEINACEHTLLLLPDNTRGPIDAAGLAHCASCDLRENLWLCLTCGSLGCGRQQFGGVSGNGHALSHYEQTRHPVAVKLGTITAEGSADMYCYACNDATIDPELPAHLASFGINVQTQKKTEKSMTELQLEQNFMFEFSMTDESGNAFVPVFGPGLTGLQNLGNSCYMASVIQGLFSLPQFAGRYYDPDLAAAHFLTCRESLPAACLECQMYKLGDGLLSGRYSVPRPALKDGNSPHAYSPGAPADDLDAASASPVVFQEGVKPTSFKALVGKGHAEFSTMKQQDAEEFLSHLLKSLRTYARKVGVDEKAEPTEVFKFGMEQRLQCLNCKRVRYKVDEADLLSVPVPAHRKMDVDVAPVEGKDAKEEKKPEYEDVALTECIDIVVENEVLSYRCPGCNADVTATKSSRFATFPQVLVVHAKKFQLIGWVPTKLDIPVILPENGELILDKYKGAGLQPGEEQLPEEAAVEAALPAFNAEAMAQLEGMGFPTIRCQKALLATGNSSADAAMEWLFGHMDDPDIDAPLDLGGGVGGAGGAAEPSAESIAMLADMGFTSAQARKALKETGGNAERAVEWLFNHPDDAGEDASAAPSSSSAPAAPSVGGSATLPAKYSLKAFISHKGPSVHSGHYVAHIRTDEGWVLFNDEKVVKADDESVKALRKLAYLYIFERI